MILRAITVDDVPAVAAFALEALGTAGSRPVHVSAAKVRGAVHAFATVPGHFQIAAFADDGSVAGALAAWVSEMPFHERCEAHVMLCYATLAGAGARMIRAFMAWVDNEPRVQRIVWAMNEATPTVQRMQRMLERRHGFRKLDMLVRYKGDNPANQGVFDG